MTVETFVPRTFAPGSLELIARARNVLDQYARQGYDLSLRQLYYQFVSRGWLDNNDRNYKRLGSVINDARLAGLIDWGMIKDRGRTTTTVPHWTDPAQIVDAAARSFRIDKWESQPVHVEVMVEKQALEGVLVPVCREVDIAFAANKGYSSASAMYEAGKRMKVAMDAGKRVVVLYLGDHDPSGIDMGRDVRERLEMFTGYRWYDSDDAKWYRDPTYDGDQITVNRLALNMEQVEEYNPPPNPAKLALALDTPLPTPSGWTTMGEVAVGDTLFGSDGHPYPVTSKSPVFTNKRCLRFTFSGGDQIVSSEDHLWDVDARGGRRCGVMSSAYIARTWCEGVRERPVYRVRIAAPLTLPDAGLAIPPYILGAWLGDGNSDAEGFACGMEDEELLQRISGEGYRVARHPSFPVACTIYGLRGQLYKLGVANNKHIPPQYLRASYAQRMALLQGLMDTDGTVGKNRSMTPCSFGSSRRNLAEQVLELVISLGIRGRLSESRAVLNGKDHGPAWRVEFHPGDFDAFRLNRKRTRLIGATVAERQHWRSIINVEEVGVTGTQCLSIASPNHLFLAGRHFIPTHNTDSRVSGYLERFGDTSWELDALEPTVLASLVRDAAVELRDEDLWDEAVARETAMRDELFSFAATYHSNGAS